MEKCPDRFYRFRSMAEGSSEWVERTICHNEIYFPKPLSFNDPFDCRPSFNLEASDKEMISYYEGLLAKYAPHLNRQQRRREAKSKIVDWKRSPNNSETVDRITIMHTQQITEEIGVLCLSIMRDDILMWSHYADSHRGICLEFDGHFDFFAHAQEVKYPAVRPRINPFRQNRNEMMEAALLSKSNHWEYEQEWRLIQYTKGPGVYNFPPEALTGVIFGAHISHKDRDKVIRWISARELPVKLYSSSPCGSTFSLNISEYAIGSVET